MSNDRRLVNGPRGPLMSANTAGIREDQLTATGSYRSLPEPSRGEVDHSCNRSANRSSTPGGWSCILARIVKNAPESASPDFPKRNLPLTQLFAWRAL